MYSGNIKSKYRKGFTILELLVVIAIISIIAAVVLVALNQTRYKGKDVAIKSQLVEARKEAQLYFESMDGKFCDYDGGTNCFWGGSDGSNTAYCGDRNKMVFSDSLVPKPNTIGRFITASEANMPSGYDTMCFMDDYGERWSIAMKLNAPVDAWWCIDSVGNAKSLSGTAQDVRDSINGNSLSQTCP